MYAMLLKSTCLCITRITIKAFEPVCSYAKKAGEGDCRRAIVDIPKDSNPKCEKVCDRMKMKRPSFLHKIKLRVIEGGTNFGTPFRFLKCAEEDTKPSTELQTSKELVTTEKESQELSTPVKASATLPVPVVKPGVQVTVLGADTNVGQYIALLLKQCDCIKKLRLFDARVNMCHQTDTARDLCHVVRDLQHIDTNCRVQMYRNTCGELERSLQNTDIVLMLESGYVNWQMPYEERFCTHAPIVKVYADAIANECPKAFIIVCPSPIECMVPLVAETLKETGWYDPRKVFGSMAVPEMRASTIAARALCLEPRYTKIPCIGGTEGHTLVPLFSKAVEYFDFATHNAEALTDAVRKAPVAVSKSETDCLKASFLSEAHALSGLVTKVANALLCQDTPRVTGFVETDISSVISPSRYIATIVDLGTEGISQWLGLPKLADREVTLLNIALDEIETSIRLSEDWHSKVCYSTRKLDMFQKKFLVPGQTDQYIDCAYISLEVLINKTGICKTFDIPHHLNRLELEQLDCAFPKLENNINFSYKWINSCIAREMATCKKIVRTEFLYNKHYDHLKDCAYNLT